jgi:hypothetical protein
MCCCHWQRGYGTGTLELRVTGTVLTQFLARGCSEFSFEGQWRLAELECPVLLLNTPTRASWSAPTAPGAGAGGGRGATGMSLSGHLPVGPGAGQGTRGVSAGPAAGNLNHAHS